MIPVGRPARSPTLASPEAGFVTGQVISVNGSSSMG